MDACSRRAQLLTDGPWHAMSHNLLEGLDICCGGIGLCHLPHVSLATRARFAAYCPNSRRDF
eukprot:9473453-Pyramimonas_sp.AAC.1